MVLKDPHATWKTRTEHTTACKTGSCNTHSLLNCATVMGEVVVRSLSASSFVAAQVDLGLPLVIIGQRARDVGEMLRAADAPKVHERIVGLSTGLEPMVPVIPPLAAGPQGLWQALASGLLEAPSVVVVAIEVAAGVPSELCRATIGEDALAGPWDLQIEAVVAVHIVADVSDLHNHAPADELGVRTSPVTVLVPPIRKPELEALPAIGVSEQAVAATHRDR